MLQRSRPITILLIVLVILIAVLLWVQTLASTSMVIQEKVGNASIYFAADRDRLIFPGECVVVTWNLESIKEVYLNGRGRIGSGQQELCLLGEVPTLQVVFQDESSRDFQLPIQPLYEKLFNALLLLLLGGLISIIGYRLFGTSTLVVVLTILLLWPLMRVEVNQGSNMIDHIFFAQSAWDTQNFGAMPPHFLYHILLIGLHQLFPILNMENAGFIVIMICYAMSSFITYRLLRSWTGISNFSSRIDIIFCTVTIGLLYVNALALMIGADGTYIGAGYFNPNAYHSPTMIVMRPFVLLLFGESIWMMNAYGKLKIWHVVGIGVVTVLATLAKPSYSVVLLPALMVVLVYRFIRKRRIGSDYLLAIVFVAAGAVLFWQYRYLYDAQTHSAFVDGYSSIVPRIVFSPFELLTVWWSVGWEWIIPHLLLFIAFPLVVYIAYFRRARVDLALNLAWLSLGAGVAITYLLVEVPGQSNGNFTWSGQIALLILFTISAGFLLRQPFLDSRGRYSWQFVGCSLIFFAHVMSGLVKLY